MEILSRGSRGFLLLLGALTALAVSACSTPQTISVEEGVRRTTSDSWKTREFKEAGFRAELPARLCAETQGPKELVIGLHLLRPPLGAFAEDSCLLEISFERMTEEAFDRQRAFNTTTLPEQEQIRKLVLWRENRHPSISRFDVGKYTYYRYDTDCAASDLLRMEAQVLKIDEAGSTRYSDEDDVIVRRILGSASCLP